MILRHDPGEFLSPCKPRASGDDPPAQITFDLLIS